ncbi:hydroxypyruvate isomerase family protein [Ancylobacter vacuolatus]|uniref:Hydroxypyruvate isomerase n=1 Tax=Ancylobacter vacuolatus TaxID=223389 RepID=A0ABU0DEL6_9HYPH|nr:TIM barrel protein [Ancylobacter vacuolatus]MDQ0346827.1 hydroxypyruvate isomerase [Ancylobacter vacuolatus]
MTQRYRYSAHLGFLFTELAFPERFRAARLHGFSAVEHPAPYGVPAAQMAQWLEETGLPYVQFGLYSGDAAKGEKGLAIFPERRAEFRASVAAGLDYAATIGVGMLHAMAGILPKPLRQPAHRDCYIENLAWAADRAAERGVVILVEAMSAGAVPDYFVETPDEAAAAIAETGRGNIRLLLDVFHTVNSGLDPLAQIRAHAGAIGHVHIADHPGRHEPGSAGIDFNEVRRALAEAGYDGFIGCEYNPRGATVDGLTWLAKETA